MDAYCPESGDCIWVDFEVRPGEGAVRRQAVVISAKSYNQSSGLCLLCPIIHYGKGVALEVASPALEAGARVLSAHIITSDWRAMHAKFIKKIPPELLSEVRENVAAVLELE
jgi:mRNA-degrading endonuclease toxin of MazEF toxin-antitoxin module